MDTAPERSATERLNEQLDALPEDEREAVAEDALRRMAFNRWYEREMQPALDSHTRGESTPWEGSRAFIERLKSDRSIE